jgi:hypothetical protein
VISAESVTHESIFFGSKIFISFNVLFCLEIISAKVNHLINMTFVTVNLLGFTLDSSELVKAD